MENNYRKYFNKIKALAIENMSYQSNLEEYYTIESAIQFREAKSTITKTRYQQEDLHYCPICNISLDDIIYDDYEFDERRKVKLNFCPNCGQCLDHSKE